MDPERTCLSYNFQDEFIQMRTPKGELMHPNFQRRLETICGLQVWRESDNFEIDDHVIEAPSHFHHNLVTSSNIQVRFSKFHLIIHANLLYNAKSI